MRSSSLLAASALVGLGLALPLAPAVAGEQGAATMPVSQIKPGMKGYGLTVFRGTEPERFDVEVIDVLKSFRPAQDLVLVKTSHPRLDVARVVAGMSGSPIFLEGKMIGAYAYGWQFPSESVAGVTPIGSMLDEMARPVAPIWEPLPGTGARRDPRARPRAEATRAFHGDPSGYDVREHARQMGERLAPPTSADAPRLVPAATPLVLGGMTEHATRLASELFSPLGLEPLQGGGSGGRDAAPDAPTRFVDGGAIGVRLVTGDMSAMGTGTVTRVEGDRLVAFGHPMTGAGVSAMPTAIARVLWVMATQARSFKMAESVRPLGTLVNDRQAAIVVDQRRESVTVPTSVVFEGVAGAPRTRWSFDVVHEKFMTPSLVALATGSAIEATTSEKRDVSWRATTEIEVRGHGKLELEDVGVSVGGTPDVGEWSHSRAVRALGAILNNAWEDARVERVSTTFRVKYARDVLRLRGAEVETPVVDAGQSARIRLRLESFAGGIETRVVEVPVPAELAGRDVDVELAPGYAESPELPSPESLDDLVANLPRAGFAPESIVASIRVPEAGVAYRGQVATRLPPSAFDALRPASATAAPEPFPAYVRTAIPLGRLLDGRDRVRVRVRTPLH